MSIVRMIPQSISGYILAMNTAKAKKDGVTIPADNILSDATSTRLDTDVTNYNNGKAAIVAANQIYHASVELARPQRRLLRRFIISFYNSLNNAIALKTILASARAYYGLEISNKKMPDMKSDAKLLAAADLLISGDAARRLAGGIAIVSPTIAQVNTTINTAKPIIAAISNAKTVVTTAISSLKKQNAEIKDLITHIWDEVEAHYSLDDASSKRDQGRLWGIKYRGHGEPSEITGLCTDSITLLPLFNVQLYLVGVGKRVMSDADGNFIINTSIYDLLEMNAKLVGYEDKKITFKKEDGMPLVQNVVMVKTV